MTAKRFTAPDMRRALQLVREQLGDDAVIIHNKIAPEGVELIATTAAAVDAQVGRVEPADHRMAPSAGTLSTTPADTVEPEAPHPGHRAAVHKTIRGRVRDLGRLERFGWGHSSKTKASKTTASKTTASKKTASGETSMEADQAFSVTLSQVESAEAVGEENKQPASATSGSQRAADRYELVMPKPNQRVLSSSATSTRAVDSAVIHTLREEVNLLRCLLQSQNAERCQEQFEYTQPLRAYLLQQLLAAGFMPKLAREWVGVVETERSLKAAWKNILHTMLMRLPIETSEWFEPNTAVALVGPTGSGKTSTIGKLAAQYVAAHGADSLAIITTDAYRLGAHDQLRTLTRILGVPLTIVDDHVSLKRALDTYVNRRNVLIDTAGLNQRDPAWQQQLTELAACQQRVKHYLVVSTTNQFSMHIKALTDYRSLSVSGCILTKLDEAVRLGDSLSAVIDAKLPVAYVTTGIRMPDDLNRAEALPLIKQALAAVRGSCVDPESVTACFVDEGCDPRTHAMPQSPVV
ncbi:MAG: flagellar biosynthesis protein FlhF [Gammaproteobacteria bacterium]